MYFFFQKSTVTAMDGSNSMIGSIDLKCEISPIIESAYGAARDILPVLVCLSMILNTASEKLFRTNGSLGLLFSKAKTSRKLCA